MKKEQFFNDVCMFVRKTLRKIWGKYNDYGLKRWSWFVSSIAAGMLLADFIKASL